MLALAACLLLPQVPLVFERFVSPAPASGHTLVQPVGVTGRPGDDRLFVTEMVGAIRIVRDGVVDTTPFVDVTSRIVATGLAGLRAMTFHPQYDVNGFVYLWYDASDGAGGLDLVLARITRDALAPNRTDPSTLVELLRINQDVRGHGGGAIQFGPDGMLWIGVGDGGMQDDIHCRSQDLGSRLGKLLRIDVDAAFPYAVPPTNPFVHVPGAAPEIAHVGFRHPWKWSFDRVTGDLWIGDVGQWEREEVNFVRAGALGLNFGWTAMEGTICHDATGCPPTVAACGSPEYTPPIFEYDHTEGCSVTGGFVYRGSQFPEMLGAYVCTDFCTRKTWTLRYDGNTLTEAIERSVEILPLSAPPISASSFGEDGDGELILIDHASGSLFRMRRPCVAATTCFGEPNVTGRRAVLRFIGSTSLTAATVQMRVTDLPPTTQALLFYGPQTIDAVLGNGRLCVGGGIIRVSVQVASPSGTTTFVLDLNAAPFSVGPGQIRAGSTWTFQAWYRDIGGPLGATSNLSSATTITFCP